MEGYLYPKRIRLKQKTKKKTGKWYLHCRIWTWSKGERLLSKDHLRIFDFPYVFTDRHSILSPIFASCVWFFFLHRLKMWIAVGTVMIVFTFFYSTLGKWAEHLNDKMASKQRNNDDSKRRPRHPHGKDDNTNGFSRRNNGPPVSRLLIQCYQLSLGFAVTKLPRSASTRY